MLEHECLYNLLGCILIMFNESLILVKAVEAYLVGETLSKWPLVSYIQRLIWFPLKFLKIGMSEKTKGMYLWSIIASVFVVIVTWIQNNSGIAKTETATIISLIALIIPMFLVMFAMPSIYAHSGINQKTVSFVKHYLIENGFSTEKQIEILKKSLKPMEDRSRERVTALKWLVGLGWAGIIYTFSQGQEFIKTQPQQLSTYLYFASGLLISVVVAYFVVWGYETSLDKLFRSIEFGCNDFIHEAHSDKNKLQTI